MIVIICQALTNVLFAVIFLGDVFNEIDDAVRIPVLVVVPRDEFDEVVIQRNAGLGIEDRRVSVTDEVGRDDFLIGVAQDAFQRAVGGFLDRRADLFVFRLSLTKVSN